MKLDQIWSSDFVRFNNFVFVSLSFMVILRTLDIFPIDLEEIHISAPKLSSETQFRKPVFPATLGP
jgi:hypothetical protein